MRKKVLYIKTHEFFFDNGFNGFNGFVNLLIVSNGKNP